LEIILESAIPSQSLKFEVNPVTFDKKIPDPVLKRMPIYYRYLSKLLQLGISRISSKDLANVMEINSSQVRQDFFNFGGNGLQGYGYDVKYLYREIHQILGLNALRNVIVIGAGSLGQALAKHTNFEKEGFNIVGVFDTNPQLVGKRIRDTEIRHLDTLPEMLETSTVDIAAITVPEAYAYEVASLVIDLGIKGIWNFAPVELKVPPDVVVENIHLSDSLIVLGYRLSESKKEFAPAGNE
jgi:redox-sensing transcriptional repressor